MNIDVQPMINLVTQTGIWCLSTYILAKYFLDYIKSDKEQEKEDRKLERTECQREKDRLYGLIESQNRLMEQQKDLLSHNRDMLTKLTEVEMLHSTRLDRIEDKIERLKRE